jgi:hypothetical protein
MTSSRDILAELQTFPSCSDVSKLIFAALHVQQWLLKLLILYETSKFRVGLIQKQELQLNKVRQEI